MMIAIAKRYSSATKDINISGHVICICQPGTSSPSLTTISHGSLDSSEAGSGSAGATSVGTGIGDVSEPLLVLLHELQLELVPGSADSSSRAKSRSRFSKSRCGTGRGVPAWTGSSSGSSVASLRLDVTGLCVTTTSKTSSGSCCFADDREHQQPIVSLCVCPTT